MTIHSLIHTFFALFIHFKVYCVVLLFSAERGQFSNFTVFLYKVWLCDDNKSYLILKFYMPPSAVTYSSYDWTVTIHLSVLFVCFSTWGS